MNMPGLGQLRPMPRGQGKREAHLLWVYRQLAHEQNENTLRSAEQGMAAG